MTTSEIDKLFAESLSGRYEDDAPWEAVRKLRQTGSRQVFNQAADWCKSEDPLMRARGIDVLAQLGKTPDHPSNSFPEECFAIVSELIQRERNERPLSSAIAALGHLDNPLAIPLIAGHESNLSAEVRFSVACALGSFPNNPRSVKSLMRLTEDTDEDVRDWATFGLGVLGDLDSTEIRDALLRRFSDANEDVREEAIAGLAKRRDERVLPSLIAALERPPVTDRVIEAAYQMLEMADKRQDWSAEDYAAALRERFRL